MLDPALAVLPEEDRNVIVRWLFNFGLEPEHLDVCPPLRHVVDMLAAVTLVSQLTPPATRNDAFATTATMLNGKNLLRTWYRWQEAAALLDASDTVSDGDAELDTLG